MSCPETCFGSEPLVLLRTLCQSTQIFTSTGGRNWQRIGMSRSSPNARNARPTGSSKLTQRAKILLKSLDTDVFELLEKANLPGADLLVITGDDDIPDGPDLEKRCLSTYKQAQALEGELREVVAALTIPKESKKVFLRTLKDFGRAREAHGRVNVQFEMVAGEHLFSRSKAKKSAQSNPSNLAERTRTDLVKAWIAHDLASGGKGTHSKRFRLWVSPQHKANLKMPNDTWQRVLSFSDKTWRRTVKKAKAELKMK